MQNTLSGIKDIFSGLKKEQKQMLVLAVIVTVVMLFVYVNMLLRPQLEGLFNTAGRVSKLKADVKKAESDIARIGQLKKSMASYSEKMDRYGEVLPAEESMPALLESLADMARSSNMKIVGVAPIEDRSGKPVRGQAYKSMPIAVNARAGFHERGKVTYDDRTNTVIVTDIPTNIYKIGEIVSRLDKRTEQVLIEARILETILGDDEKLGIDWNLKITATGAQRPTTVPFNFLGKGNEYLNQFLPLSQVATATAQGAGAGSTAVLVPPADFPANSNGEKSFPFAIKDNFTFGTLDFTEFQAVLEFLKERSNTDIISNPRIATLNNSPALINVGQTLNMPTYERNSTTGKMEVTGYEAKDLGILLQVTPHVNDNGEITIDLAPIISDLLRYDTLDRAAGIVAPIFSVRQAKTQVMIKDTQTIFIGGLIKENDIEIDNKVPFIGDLLGDIPYLGLLVNHKTTRKQKSELIFFITVNLMNSDKDIKNIPKASEAYVPIYTATTAPDPNPKKKLKTKQSL